ncbi:MAG: transcriptional regulator NrdR [Tissierellia bacterium]|nr:transcriptional regulator NrdR [Tissierellia bacterium]
MKCPYCGYLDSKVVDTRPTEEGQIRRRRQCIKCNKRFTTYEKIDELAIRVIKKDGTRESFDRNKLLNGIVKSCEKRPVSASQVEEIVNEIERTIQNNLIIEISSHDLGEMVMDELKKVDEVAYVRFASVYRQFKDVESFMEELSEILKDKKE